MGFELVMVALALVVLIGTPVVIGVWLRQRRCPNCQANFGRVEREQKDMKLKWTEDIVDDKGRHRTVKRRGHMYMLHLRCRRCGHTWTRSETR